MTDLTQKLTGFVNSVFNRQHTLNEEQLSELSTYVDLLSEKMNINNNSYYRRRKFKQSLGGYYETFQKLIEKEKDIAAKLIDSDSSLILKYLRFNFDLRKINKLEIKKLEPIYQRMEDSILDDLEAKLNEHEAELLDDKFLNQYNSLTSLAEELRKVQESAEKRIEQKHDLLYNELDVNSAEIGVAVKTVEFYETQIIELKAKFQTPLIQARELISTLRKYNSKPLEHLTQRRETVENLEQELKNITTALAIPTQACEKPELLRDLEYYRYKINFAFNEIKRSKPVKAFTYITAGLMFLGAMFPKLDTIPRGNAETMSEITNLELNIMLREEARLKTIDYNQALEALDSKKVKINLMDEENKVTKEGIATIYGYMFEGRITYSEAARFSHKKLMAAVPQNSRWQPEKKGDSVDVHLLKIMNLENSKSVIVPAFDTGDFGYTKKKNKNKYPYMRFKDEVDGKIIKVKEERVVDISKRTAYELGIITKKQYNSHKPIDLIYNPNDAKVKIEEYGTVRMPLKYRPKN